jgi:structure-specific recognition protein 1
MNAFQFSHLFNSEGNLLSKLILTQMSTTKKAAQAKAIIPDIAHCDPMEAPVVDKKTKVKGQKRPREEKEQAGPAAKKQAVKKVKRPISAFLFFSIHNRKIIKEQNPNANFVEISKLVAAKWEGLMDTKIYDDLAAKDKARYEQELSMLTDEERQALKKGKKSTTQKPKGPKKAYNIYMNARKEQSHFAQMTKEQKATFQATEQSKWKAMDATAKKPYQDEADRQKLEFAAAQPDAVQSA